MQITMLDDEKLRDLDIPAQEEINLLSWLRTMAPAFPVNGAKVKRLCIQPNCGYILFQ